MKSARCDMQNAETAYSLATRDCCGSRSCFGVTQRRLRRTIDSDNWELETRKISESRVNENLHKKEDSGDKSHVLARFAERRFVGWWSHKSLAKRRCRDNHNPCLTHDALFPFSIPQRHCRFCGFTAQMHHAPEPASPAINFKWRIYEKWMKNMCSSLLLSLHWCRFSGFSHLAFLSSDPRRGFSECHSPFISGFFCFATSTILSRSGSFITFITVLSRETRFRVRLYAGSFYF